MEREEDDSALRLTLRHLTSCGTAMPHLPAPFLLNVNDTRRRLETQVGGEKQRKRKQKPVTSAVEKLVCEFCCTRRDVRRDVVKVERRGRKRGGNGARQQRLAISCGFCHRPYVEEEFKILTQVNNAVQ